jgi:hypothetical protein
MNIHTPERQPHESQAEYKERRLKSHAINKANRQIGQGGVSSRKQFRDSLRSSGNMGKRIRASDALMAAWASKRVTKAKLRDEHGAYTLVGRPYELDGIKPGPHEHEHSGSSDGVYVVQRKWLAGISAQRGY